MIRQLINSELIEDLIRQGIRIACQIWFVIVYLKDRSIAIMTFVWNWNRRGGRHGAVSRARNPATMTFKPASHRTSFSLPDTTAKTTGTVQRGLHARSNGTYNDLPEEIRDSIVPLRKAFSVMPQDLREQIENQPEAVETDFTTRRTMSDPGFWKMRAEITKAKLEAAKLRWESRIKCGDYVQNEEEVTEDVADESDDEELVQRLMASKGFMTIERNKDSIVMLQSGDRKSTLRKLSNLIARLKENHKNLESSFRDGDETDDFYIDDDEVLYTSGIDSHFLDGYYFGSGWSSNSIPSVADLGELCIGEYEPYAIIAGVNARTGKVMISVPAEPDHSSSIQVYANHEGVRGQHLVTVKYRHLKTGSERIPFERVIRSSCIVGVIRVHQN